MQRDTIGYLINTSDEMTRALLLTLLIALVNACSQYKDEHWTALRNMPAFAEPNDDRTHPIFTVRKGESCVPVTDRVAKVYAYTQVRCESGTGWVLDDFFDKQRGK
ncbi:hypothetical protein [Burkholderia anthina]|uniref:Lipoprotein n=1 Tax=Burkholderia anthina TaxID=179879 RepID=A0ABS2B865_9BURK|nr:hypothetical protein [Burkholderia anthina]MBM2768444.1 hypothetical protein [Burkholderia anthina]